MDNYRTAGIHGRLFSDWETGKYILSIRKIQPLSLKEKTMADKSGGRFSFSSLTRTACLSSRLWGITGYQIHKWYTQNRFCGCCGQRMQPHEKERAMQCPACGRISYPQICPSVIVGIIDSSRILLTKYAPGHGNFRKYALVAGYAEIGESLEDTVRREVMEEVGLRVKNIRYYKSQPWSFSDALLAGFFCEPDGNTDIVMDREELSAAGWFERESLPVERSNAEISLTGEMIEVFRNGLE